MRHHPPQVGLVAEDWMIELLRGGSEAAWDQFLDRYRRVIFAAIRHYAQDYDDVMDVFARVCEALREDDLRRLRSWAEQPTHRARFSTWLVTVVHHLTVDWFRYRDGRRRLSVLAEGLPQLQRRIYESVFLDRRSHIEAYEFLRSSEAPGLTFRQFRQELRATYRAMALERRGTLLRDAIGTTVPLSDAEPEPEDSAMLGGVGHREQIERALGSLDPADRVAVQLYVLDELPPADVARIVGLPNVKAVYNRVYRALETLRARLEQAGIRREDL